MSRGPALLHARQLGSSRSTRPTLLASVDVYREIQRRLPNVDRKLCLLRRQERTTRKHCEKALQHSAARKPERERCMKLLQMPQENAERLSIKSEFHRTRTCMSSMCKQPVRKQVIKNYLRRCENYAATVIPPGSGIGFHLCLIPKRAPVVGLVASAVVE
jgi:hypothetical protein